MVKEQRTLLIQALARAQASELRPSALGGPPPRRRRSWGARLLGLAQIVLWLACWGAAFWVGWWLQPLLGR